MTKLLAEIVDFKLEERADGNGDEYYCFRFGKCDDFSETFEEFKERIPYQERKPNPDQNWIWQVKASAKNFAILDDLFDNFHVCYDTAKSQMKMFG